MEIRREIITTADGSKTIRIPDWDENYHSSHGALQEARHVFLQYGLDALAGRPKVSVLEIGFGTGLNAILTLERAAENGMQVTYDGLEAYPVSSEEVEALAYEQLLKNEEMRSYYQKLHAVAWDTPQEISPWFTVTKIHDKLENMQFDPLRYDIVYFDAFGPRAQEEMWQLKYFQQLFEALTPGGMLVTYCAKGQVKRDLRAAGFEVEALPGPPGKREMTRAWKR